MEQNQQTVPTRPEFGVHLLNEDGVNKAKLMAQKFSELAFWLEQTGMCVESRELSLARTKLEEACFFAKKAMATNLANQKTQ